jgi:excisionase family DNA binding protein
MPDNSPNQNPDGLFTVKTAAAYLTISERTLRSHRQLGLIPVVYVSKRRIAFDKADLDAYREQQKQRGPRGRFGRRP